MFSHLFWSTRPQGSVWIWVIVVAVLIASFTVALARQGWVWYQAKVRKLEADVEQAAADNRRLQQAMEEAQSVAKMGTWELDLFNGSMGWSPEMRRMVGISDGEAPPALERLLERTHPEDRDRLDALLQRAFAGVPTSPLEHRLLLPDGTLHWVRTRLVTVSVKGRGFSKVLGKCQNITEHRLAASAIRQTQHLESLGVLAGGIAQDFDHVARSFSTYLTQAKVEAAGQERLEPVLRGMENTLTRASALAGQILGYIGSIGSGRAPLDLDALLLSMVPLLEAATGAKEQLVLDLQSPLPALDGDEGQLKQMVLALVTNAAEAMAETSGTILVGSGTQVLDAARIKREYPDQDLLPGTYVSLDIRDTGCGMNAETVSKIFDPFFTTKQRGRGIGLAAVKGIVASHGGGIHITSRPGDGTSVRVILPASNAQIPVSDVHADAKPTRSQDQPLVLVADDDPVLLQSAAETLNGRGIRVLQAADGREAVALFAAHKDDVALVLLDVNMPRMNGWEALAAIRDLQPDARIFLCSGYVDGDILSRVRPTGFLPKPYRMRDLAAVIATQLFTPIAL